jgi:hypothetical protein
MTATPSIELPAWMAELLSLRLGQPSDAEVLDQTFAEALMWPSHLTTPHTSMPNSHTTSVDATPACQIANIHLC